ncbi:MAG: hypothetical protein AB2693_19890 [Candidatus Thiodiazotropha sp.]
MEWGWRCGVSSVEVTQCLPGAASPSGYASPLVFSQGMKTCSARTASDCRAHPLRDLPRPAGPYKVLSTPGIYSGKSEQVVPGLMPLLQVEYIYRW